MLASTSGDHERNRSDIDMTTVHDDVTLASSSTKSLAKFAAELDLDAVPESVVEAAKTLMLDSLGCTLYAGRLPWSRLLQKYVAGEEARPRAAVWGTDIATSPALAALANGTAGHGFEIDDVDHRSGLHAGSVTVPVILGLAESEVSVTGREILTAMIAGLEVGLRVGVAVQPGHFLRGYHPQGTVGPIAAAAAGCRLLRLDQEQTQHAFGLAGSMAAGLMGAQQGGMVKRLHAGRAAQSGVVASLLARGGFTGTDDVFDIEFGGYLSTLQGQPGAIDRLAAQIPQLGERWLIPDIGYKIHASCAANHSTLDVVRSLRLEHNLKASDVESVRVTTSHTTFVHCGWPYVPGDIVNAQMSLRYGAAAMLMTGSAFVDQFTEDRVSDPDVIALTKRIDVVPDESVDAQGNDNRHIVRVEIEMKDGRVFTGTATHRRGSLFEPVGREEILDKFRLLTKNLDGVDGASILSAVLALETSANSEDLTSFLHSPAPDGR
jgi:2-methylcitrate dehydratase PrpD